MDKNIIQYVWDELSPETIAVIEADVQRIADEKTREALIKEKESLEAIKAEGIDNKIASLNAKIEAVDN